MTVLKLLIWQVCFDLGAKLLIDDSAENALQCATSETPTPVLLFGDYEWNKRLSGPGDMIDEMIFERRFVANGQREFWKDEKVDLPEGAPVHRVKEWEEVVKWVRQAKANGKM